ncbi:MAG: TolC family protein [Treponema sp.]|jgi:outer membrane protein TolC|nr:TolC family protein [Treponema sp.]
MIRCIKSLGLAALLLLLGALLFGQEKMPLTPESAVELAIRNNLSLESSRVDLDTKKRASDLVWNQFLPDLSLAGTLSRQNWATTSQGFNISTVPPYSILPYSIEMPQWNVNGTFNATLTFSFALIEGIKSFRLNYQAGQVNFEKARAQIEQNVRKSYNNILLLQQSVALQKENLETAIRRYEMADANYRAGLAPRLTVLQAQVAMENMKPTISESENNLKALFSSFAMTLGLPFDTSFELAAVSGTDFAMLPGLGELISQASNGSLDILELQANLRYLASARKAQAMQMYTPYLRFGWTLSSTYNPMLDPFKNTWFDRDNWNKGGAFSLVLGINLNSLFPFTKEGQALKDTDNNVRKLNIGLAQAVRGTELQIFTTVNALEQIRTNVEAAQLTVNLAEESYRQTEEAYRAGLQDFLEVQAAGDQLSQAKLQVLSHEFNYLNNLLDLEYYTGISFGTLSSGAGN